MWHLCPDTCLRRCALLVGPPWEWPPAKGNAASAHMGPAVFQAAKADAPVAAGVGHLGSISCRNRWHSGQVSDCITSTTAALEQIAPRRHTGSGPSHFASCDAREVR